MPITYRRPGVYLEESLLVNASDTASTFTVAVFVGVAEKGPINEPYRCDAWSDYVTVFGGFSPFQPPDTVPPGPTPPPKAQSYLPFSVWSFFQSGGRTAWIIRAAPTDPGTTFDTGVSSSVSVNGTVGTGASNVSFVLSSLSVGTWGNRLRYTLGEQDTFPKTDGAGLPIAAVSRTDSVFALQISILNADGVAEIVETFSGLSIKGDIPGSKRLDVTLNDPNSGSRYVRVSGVNTLRARPTVAGTPTPLTGGKDPKLPTSGQLTAAASLAAKIEGPINLNVVGYHSDISLINTGGPPPNTVSTYVGGQVPSSILPDRSDVIVFNDSAPPRLPATSSATYKAVLETDLGANPGDSYSASYGPWILIPHPGQAGATVAVPPGGAVLGVVARIDATVGVFRAPAGVIAGISNAVGVQTKFTDTELGDLNSQNINIIRSVPGQGICIMGARTRKSFAVDRYLSARRTLIYIKEVLRRTTQFAIFENNDPRLWSSLMMAADRILRPLWEAGGLKGANGSEAYFIRCDDILNNAAVVAAGEVRMEVGVALQYPAEFVIIRITQYERSSFTTEVQPNS